MGEIMGLPQIDVLGIGNAIVDVIARVDDGFVEKHGLVKGSMNLIDENRAVALYGDMGPAIEVSGASRAISIALLSLSSSTTMHSGCNRL